MVWDKWTPDVAARSLLMPLLGCVGWHWHCDPDGEGMAGVQMPGFSMLVTLVWGQMHRKGRAWSPVPAPCCCLVLSHWDVGLWTLGSSLIRLPIQQVVFGVCGM